MKAGCTQHSMFICELVSCVFCCWFLFCASLPVCAVAVVFFVVVLFLFWRVGGGFVWFEFFVVVFYCSTTLSTFTVTN